MVAVAHCGAIGSSPMGAGSSLMDDGSSTMANRTVEASHLPVCQTLAMLGMPRTTYSRWYDRWSDGGVDALEDAAPHPGSVWNRLPDKTRADTMKRQVDAGFSTTARDFNWKPARAGWRRSRKSSDKYRRRSGK